MLIGGVVCDKETAKVIRSEIATYRRNKGLPNGYEFHFSELTPERLDLYKGFVDIFFQFYGVKCDYKRGTKRKATFRRACFEVMLIDHSKVDHARFSAGDRELGFFRFYYTVLANTLNKHYVEGRQFHITIDKLTTKDPDRVPALHRRLNGCCEPTVHDPVKTVQAQDSKAESLLQMADVLIGSVGRMWNEAAKSPSARSAARLELAEYVQRKLVDKDLTKRTQPFASFNIWEMDLR